MSDTIDWYSLIARERGAPTRWQWYEVRAIGERDILVKGAVCTALFKRGPRKGEQNWAKRYDDREMVITADQLVARKARYELETGQCMTCQGSTQEWSGWSSKDGNSYRPCSRCKATGKAPEAT